MAQLFQPLFQRTSNTFARVFFFGIPISLLTLGAIAIGMKWSTYQTQVGEMYLQPIPFSHQHHVSGLGIDCRYCHSHVEKSAYAGMPSQHTCMSCHSQIWTNAKILEPLRQGYRNHIPIQWNRVYRLPDFVYFNHSIHVAKKINCSSCHGSLESMPLTWKFKPFYMSDCLDCHQNNGAHLMDCYTCHR